VTGEERPLPPGIDLAAYRIVQEGLTNALRHAGASVADVMLDYHPARLEITVDDDGAGQSGAARSAISVGIGNESTADRGHGLVGVQERVGLYGGAMSREVSPTGGFRLRATLPLETPR
jgi:signal transduction histidine kinase